MSNDNQGPKSSHIPATKCGRCKALLFRATVFIGAPRKPAEDDLVFCNYCGAAAFITAELGLRAATKEEWVQIRARPMLWALSMFYGRHLN
jgi:hypothetical protein